MLAQQPDDERVESERDLGIVLAGWHHGGLKVLGDQCQQIAPLKRQTSGRPLVQHHAQGVQVGPAIKLLTLRLFWCNVLQGAQHSTVHRQARGHCASQSKVDQLGCAIGSQKHVFRF